MQPHQRRGMVPLVPAEPGEPREAGQRQPHERGRTGEQLEVGAREHHLQRRLRQREHQEGRMVRRGALVRLHVAEVGQRPQHQQADQHRHRHGAAEQPAPVEVRHQEGTRHRRQRAAEDDQHHEGLERPGAALGRHADLDQDAAGAEHRPHEVALRAARQRELGGTVGPGGAEAARGEGEHAQREVAAVAEPLDPCMLLQDAEHRAQRVGARGPHQFVGRGVDAARDVAGEEREQRVVEVVDRRDQPDRPGHPRHGREAARLPGEGRCVHDAGRSARRCARASSTGSPASRRST